MDIGLSNSANSDNFAILDNNFSITLLIFNTQAKV